MLLTWFTRCFHWRMFVKKLIASAYANSSNSLGFNPILQIDDDLWFMRWFVQYLSPKWCPGFSWFFKVWVLLLTFWWKANFRTIKSPKVKISLDPCTFKNFLHTVLKILPAQINWKHSKFFSKTWSFFHKCNTTNLGVIFFCTKN